MKTFSEGQLEAQTDASHEETLQSLASGLVCLPITLARPFFNHATTNECPLLMCDTTWAYMGRLDPRLCEQWGRAAEWKG